MIKALKVRLYPTEEQMVLLEKHFGANRFIWNHFLEARTKYYAESKSRGKAQGLNYFQTCKMLTEMKKEKEWLYEISSPTLQQTLRKLDNAFTSFFRKNTDYPKFKSKKDNQYFVVPQNGKIVGNRIVIPKFLEGIIFRDKFDFSKIKEIDQIVVTKDVERYYASIFYESDEIPEKAEAVVGIDVGVRHFITMSDGIQVEPLNAYRKMEKKLKREQRRLSRKRRDRRTGESR